MVFRNSQVSAIFIQARGIEKTPVDKFLNFFYTVSGLDLFAAGLDVTFEFLSFLNTSSTKRPASMGSSIDFGKIYIVRREVRLFVGPEIVTNLEGFGGYNSVTREE